MKKLTFLSILTLFVGLFSSCNKCKDLDCQNGATCEKREGVCICTFLYEGELCADEIRKTYAGKYNGTLTYPNPANPIARESSEIAVDVKPVGSSAAGIGVDFTFFGSDYELTGVITEKDKFTINNQSININGFGDVLVLESSNGTFSNGTVNANINMQLEDFPLPINLTFSGIK